MRIEIKAYGSGAGTTNEMLEKIDGFIGKQRRVVDTFAAVKQSVHNMNGGVGILQGAVSELDSRIAVEEQKLDNAVKVQTKANDFVALAKRIDAEVAVKVTINKAIFYKKNPWAKPPVPPREKKWYEKALDFVGGVFHEAGEIISEGVSSFVDWAKGALKDAKDWIVDKAISIKNWAVDTYNKITNFVKEHATVIKIALSAVAIAACVVVACFCPAASPALIVAAKMALAGMAIEGIANTPKLVSGLIAPGEGRNRADVVADFLFQSTFDGMANGVSEVNPFAGAAIKVVSGGLNSWMSGDGFIHGAVMSGIEFGIDQITGKLIGGDEVSGIGKLIDDGAKNFVNNTINTTINTISDVVFGTDFRGKDINWVSIPIFGEGFKDFAINTGGEWLKNFVTRGFLEEFNKPTPPPNLPLPNVVPVLPPIPTVPILPPSPVIPIHPVMPVMPTPVPVPLPHINPNGSCIISPIGPGLISPIGPGGLMPFKPVPFKPVLPGGINPRMLLI